MWNLCAARLSVRDVSVGRRKLGSAVRRHGDHFHLAQKTGLFRLLPGAFALGRGDLFMVGGGGGGALPPSDLVVGKDGPGPGKDRLELFRWVW